MKVLETGLTDYKYAWDLQKKIVDKVGRGEEEETLILLRHFPVITLGRGARKENILVNPDILEKKGIKLYRIERGGDVTFHGPGQWVGYPILDLRKRGRDVHLYLRNLEEVIIRVLAFYGIQGKRIPGLTGVWVKERKIASIGVAIKKWITYHGFAFCVYPEKDFFQLINPCGLNREMTSLREETGENIEMEEVKEVIKEKFLEVFSPHD